MVTKKEKKKSVTKLTIKTPVLSESPRIDSSAANSVTPQDVYFKIFISFALIILGWLPFLNILIVFPYSFYLGYNSFKLSKSLQGKTQKICVVLAIIAMALAIFWWIVSFIMMAVTTNWVCIPLDICLSNI